MCSFSPEPRAQKSLDFEIAFKLFEEIMEREPDSKELDQMMNKKLNLEVNEDPGQGSTD